MRQGTGRRAISIDAAVIALGMAAGTLSGATGAFAQTPAASAQDFCTKLSGTFIPASAIGLPSSGAVVQSASLVAADASNNPNGEFCAVRGVIVPVSGDAPNMESTPRQNRGGAERSSAKT